MGVRISWLMLARKVAFGARGGLRLVPGHDEFLLHLLAIGDVGDHGEGAGFCSVFVVKRGCVEQAGHLRTVRPADRDLVGAGFARGPASQLLLHDRKVFLVQKLKYRPAHYFLLGSSQESHTWRG